MSGQFGFVATDPVPPSNGPTFAAEDIEECGLELLYRAWMRLSVTSRVILTERDEHFQDTKGSA